MARAVDANLHTLVDEAIRMHARADAGLVEQIHCDLFDDAGADPAKDVVGGLPLKDDVINAVLMEQLTEQESGRAGSDDGDLRACLSLHASS